MLKLWGSQEHPNSLRICEGGAPRLTVGKDTMLKMHLRPSLKRWKNSKDEVMKVGNCEDDPAITIRTTLKKKRTINVLKVWELNTQVLKCLK